MDTAEGREGAGWESKAPVMREGAGEGNGDGKGEGHTYLQAKIKIRLDQARPDQARVGKGTSYKEHRVPLCLPVDPWTDVNQTFAM